MSLYAVQSYREFMKATLQEGAWGSVKRLAEVLKCHSTYVSQIIKGKADLSTDQAIAFCQFTRLDREATEHFLDLLNSEKAGNKETRAYFQEKIDKRLEERLNIKKRLKLSDTLMVDQEARYYNGWLPQTVHICSQLPGMQSAKAIAQTLKIDIDKVNMVLADLEDIGLITRSDGAIHCLKESVHLGKDSPHISQFHINWRMKTVSDMLASPRLPGIHYSSVVSMSPETAREIKELLLRHIEDSRALIIPSPSEGLYAYSLDFYPIAGKVES